MILIRELSTVFSIEAEPFSCCNGGMRAHGEVTANPVESAL
jgi:hypothetical protein